MSRVGGIYLFWQYTGEFNGVVRWVHQFCTMSSTALYWQYISVVLRVQDPFVLAVQSTNVLQMACIFIHSTAGGRNSHRRVVRRGYGWWTPHGCSAALREWLDARLDGFCKNMYGKGNMPVLHCALPDRSPVARYQTFLSFPWHSAMVLRRDRRHTDV